jgi:hypothetical protein
MNLNILVRSEDMEIKYFRDLREDLSAGLAEASIFNICFVLVLTFVFYWAPGVYISPRKSS